jgi:ATP-dependent helicase/nuclease subunit A
MIDFTEEQQRAIARRDRSILLSAGAGSGKTSVLVERFVRSVLDDGAEVDSILAITFTEKAAAQLKERVRGRFTVLGARAQARAAEGAWISTIHGFCARLLRTHALVAGIDPEFSMLDALGSERVAIDAFDRALGEFLGAGEDSERLRLIATYTPDRLADMVRTAYGHLRSRGQARPALPEVSQPAASGERARLAAASAAALAEIAGVEGKAVGKARAKLERCAALLTRLPETEVAEAPAVVKLSFKGTAKALRGPACEAYGEAHEAYLAHCLRTREYLDHVLLRELLALHGGHYEALKRDRSALDFDDLELLARDLLRDEQGLREHYAGRFSHLMVDEFQDTNPLQNEILELLERDNLFRVGDERQSIYRFRHADVGVFRSHREAARASGGEERISVNFRSRGEVLDAIDLTFGRLWGDGFEPLRERPGARDKPAPLTPSVELLVVDRDKGRWDERTEALAAGESPFGSGMGAVTPWRAAEARLLARRIDELTSGGPYSYRDVVVLTRVTTSMGVYERALEERGIPTHVLGGRGYWSQQQVGDLRAYLAALANPRDELALYSVLASPLAGLSLDALVLLAAAARRSRGDLWRTLEATDVTALLPDQDLERLRAFVERFRAERTDALRISLETLIDRAVTSSGYDRAVLAMPSGDRRMANVRKLMRMAREYEAAEGRDLRGFIDFVAERDLVQEREGEAPLEAEDLDAVRVMTIHRSKGLEFPVVCVADLGKRGREDDAALRISEDGQVGIRLASLEGGALNSATLEAIRERQKLEDEEEERRVFYVAATRAQEHLLLSGATDLEKLPPEAPLEEPMRWLWRALAPDLAERSASSESELEYEGRSVAVRCEVLSPATLDELLPAADRAPKRPEREDPGLAALDAPALRAVPVPPALAVSRLSYSGLDLYERCGYRFYLEHALGLPGGDELAPGRSAQIAEELSEGIPARVRGTVAHSLLERLDFDRPSPPAKEQVAGLVKAEGESASDAELTELVSLVEAFAGSPMRARIGAARRVRRELPFAFELSPEEGQGRSLLVNGVVDVHADESDGLLIVDYKSNRLGGRDPAEVAESYATQRLVYALAALKAGAARVEVAYVFLERPDAPVSTLFEASEAPALEERLLGLASGVVKGRFGPSEEPCRELCADCPGQPGLCAWGPERTLSPATG